MQSNGIATDNRNMQRSWAPANRPTDDRKASARKGWTQKDSSFNRTETDGGIAIARPADRKPSKTEKKCRPTANPTRVCLKPEAHQESKEQFAQRIRQAWIDREQAKSRINIYLARNVVEDLPSPAAEPAESAEQSPSAGGRTALEVQLQSDAATASAAEVTEDGERSAADDSGGDDANPLSAAARRVRFYKAAKQLRNAPPDRRPTVTRAMSAPPARHLQHQAGSGGSRRRSQEVLHRFPARKLKSCRNKAFHKSIDADAGHCKYGKSRNQHVEVVTMMSLLSPVGSDTEEPRPATTDDASAKTVTFPQFNIRYHQKSFDSAIQSIGKPRSLNNRVGKSLIKSKTLDISRSRDDEEDAVPVMKEPEVSKHCDNVREQEDEIAEIAVQYDVVDGQPMLKSDKEKECWALFKKMTAKGVSVTFDTVLRGMLTPTEYRLRKNELLLFG